MADETWYSGAIPILEAVRDVEEIDQAFAVQLRGMAARTGLPASQIAVGSRLGLPNSITLQQLATGGINPSELSHVIVPDERPVAVVPRDRRGAFVAHWLASPTRAATAAAASDPASGRTSPYLARVKATEW